VLTKTPLQIHNNLEVAKGVSDRSNVILRKKPVKKNMKRRDSGAFEGGLAPFTPTHVSNQFESPISYFGDFEMIILSYNLRGVGGAPKLYNLKRTKLIKMILI